MLYGFWDIFIPKNILKRRKSAIKVAVNIFLNTEMRVSLFIRDLESQRTVTGKYRFYTCCLCAALFYFINLFLQIISNSSYSGRDVFTQTETTKGNERLGEKNPLECIKNIRYSVQNFCVVSLFHFAITESN